MSKRSRKTITKPKWAEGLSAREQRFVECYRAVLCKAKAARMAGYSDANSAKQGCKLMETPRVLRAVDEAFADSPGITRTTLAEIETRIVRATVDDFLVLDEAGRLVLRPDFATLDKTAIQEIRITKRGVKLKLSDRHRGVEILGKALGLNKERPISGDPDTPQLTPDAELARKLAFLLQRGALSSEGAS